MILVEVLNNSTYSAPGNTPRYIISWITSWPTGDGTAPGGLRPKVDDVVLGPAGSNSFTVIGRELNGASGGSSYGDDVESDENFPIVYLTAKDGSEALDALARASFDLVLRAGHPRSDALEQQSVPFYVTAGVNVSLPR